MVAMVTMTMAKVMTEIRTTTMMMAMTMAMMVMTIGPSSREVEGEVN